MGMLFLIYFVLWLIIGGGGWLYVNTRPTPALRRIWWRRYSIGFAAFVILFMDLMIGASGGVVPALVMLAVLAPFGALISWLNIRNTYFCDGCGKRTTSRNPFVRLAFCPRCGARYE